MTFNYKQWHQQNKKRQNKISRDNYYRLKQQVYQPYSLHCEMPGCNECNIRELVMIPGYGTPEAEALRKVKAGDKRLRYLKKMGYSKEFGIIVLCKKCRKEFRSKTSIQNQQAKAVKAQLERDEHAKVKQALRLKKEKKAKKKREKWLKGVIESTEKIIAEKQARLKIYTERLEDLNSVEVKKGLRNWLKERLVKDKK